MLFKQVKEYSNRQRIDINKSDGLTPGLDVVIFTADEYNSFKQEILDLQNDLFTFKNNLAIKDKELELLENQEQNQEQNFKELIENIITPINETHKKELEKKDKQINELQSKLNALEMKCNQYNLDLQGLNTFEILFMRKHKDLIKQFTGSINMIVKENKKILDADASALPGETKEP